jgi:hypothetical protein
MLDAQEIIAIVKIHRDQRKEKADFKAASGMVEDAGVDTRIVEEYNALLAEIGGESLHRLGRAAVAAGRTVN